MNFAKILTVFILCFISIQFSYGVTHRVTDLADGAPKSLRTMIGLANPGDTLLIDVSGDMILNSTLDINQSVTILGPFASNFTINASGIAGTNDGVVVSANNVNIIGVGFIGVNANHYLIGLGVTGLEIKHCLFELKNGAGSAIRLENTTAKFESCSFNENNTNFDGGSVAVMGTSDADFVNCTFFNNFASGFGSAVYVDVGALYRFDHCTFFENNGGVAAVYVDGSAAIGTFNFNSSASIYLNNGPFGVTYGPGITTTFATQGANVFHNGAVNGGFVSANDVWVNDNTQVNLRNSPITDGFGLKYLPILDGTSEAIDIGGLTAVPPPPRDTRFAPRVLYGDDNLESDAGAFEYSPYYVDDNDGGNGVPNSLGWCIQQINGTANPGPYLIDFRFYSGTQQQIDQTVPYVINKDEVFIHGYTEDQSKVPGPNVPSPVALNSAQTLIGIYGGIGISGIDINGQNCAVWGLSSWGHTSFEYRVNADGITFFGNQVGLDLGGSVSSSAPNLLTIDGGAAKIGGPMHWNRNVFGNSNGGQGILMNSGNGHVIQNNYIGFASDGVVFGPTSLVNGIHILNTAVGVKVGGKRYLEGNHFGPCQTGVYNTGDNTKIQGNTFGLAFDGVNVVGGPPMNNAIHTTTSADVIIGTPGYWARNVITNFSNGIHITSSSSTIVENNLIGTDTTGNTIAGSVDKGMYLINSGGFQIGQPLTGRNVVAQGALDGIHVETTNGGTIRDNYVGLFEDGSFSTGSIANAVSLEGCQNINLGGTTAGFGNYLAQATDRLVYLNNGSLAGTINIQGNTLGLDISSNAQSTNPIGISVQDHTTPVLIGDPANSSGSNMITYCSTGVLVGELGQFSQNVRVLQNEIYNNSALGIDIHAAGGLGVTANDGVLDAASGNNEEIDYPEILSANSCDGSSNTQVAMEVTMPVGNYIIELYTNTTSDPSGHGEGQTFLTNTNITTTSSPEVVVVDAGSLLPVGTEITATLTRVGGGTSEFSANFSVTPPYTHTFTVVDPTCSGDTDGSIAIQAIGAVGFDIVPGSSVTTPDNHTFTSLTDVSYDVSIIYNNCQFDTTITLTAPTAPTVSAGADQSVCANNPTVTLNGMFGGSATGLQWTAGNGAYSSLTDPNATYTPTATEIANGTVTLTAESTGSSCATVSDDVIITFTPAPTVNAGADVNICEGDNVTLNGGFTVSSGLIWTGGNGIFNPSDTDPNAVYTPTAAEISSGSVTLTATTTGNGNCNAVMDVMTINIQEAPSANAGPDQTICEGQSAAMNASATASSSYTWTTTGSGFFSSNSVLNPSYTPSAADVSSGTVDLTLNVTGTGPCSSSTASDVITLTITPLPDPGTNGSITLCDTDPSTDLFNELGGTPDAGGTWTGPSTLSGGSSGTFDPSSMSAGTYTYEVVNGACVATADVVVTVNTCTCTIDNLTANLSACDPSDNYFDVSGTVTFTDPPTTGQLIVEDCNGNSVTFSAPFVSPINYSITDINSDGAACDVTAYFTDNATCTSTVNYTNPSSCLYTCVADAGTYNATLNGSVVTTPIEICYDDTLYIQTNNDFNVPDINPSNPGGPPTYDPGLNLLVYSCAPTVFPPNDISTDPCLVGIYSAANGNWEIINDVGDGSTVYFVPITVYSIVDGVYSFVPGTTACFDMGQVFEVTYLEEINVTPTTTDISCNGANDGAVTVAASNGTTPYNYFVDGNNTNPATNLTPGDHYIEVVDANGCHAYDTVTIVEPPAIVITATSVSDDTCNNGVGEVVLSASGGAGPYSYDFNSGGLSANNTYSNLGSGSYTAYAQDFNGCTSTTIQVVVGNYSGPDPTFTYADFCPSSNPGPTAVNPGGTYGFVTAPGDGATIDPNTGIISGATSGTTYQVVYQVGPCSSNIDVVNVTATQMDDPSFDYDDFCINDQVGPYNIATPGGDFYFNPAPPDGATIDPASGIIFDATPGYSYEVIYETPNCTNTDTVTVIALAAPVEPTLSTSQDTYCVGDTIQVISVTNNVGNNTTYNWYLNGAPASNSTATPTDFIPNLVPGQNEIYVIADSGSCSTASQSLTIYLSDSTAVGVTSPVYVCVGTDANLNVYGGNEYFWSGDYSFSNDAISTPTITVNSEGWATVEIIDQYGCLYRRSVEVLLEDPSNCDVNTYNAFSPNGDGNNETWIIDGIAGKNNRVVIFNRWGQEIKAFDNYNNQDIVWDGTNKSGGKLPPGTYYYIIEVEGQKMSGWIQIVM